jgi:Protein of unknown function (DUF1501)
MLRVLGSRMRLCDGITRREVLRAGGLGALGLGLADLGRLLETQAASPAKELRGFGKAKSCILLYLYGSPPQHEVFDLKPDAPSDVRGELKPIPTSVPGVRISELLPRTARVMDRVTLIRSLSHPYNIHGAAYALTGTPTTDIPMELNPRDGRHWPFFGSVLDYLARSNGRRDVPLSVALPWRFSSRSEPFRRGGPYGGFLGTGFDPVWVEFQGKATNGDPHRGIDPALRFQVGQQDGPRMTLDRLSKRRSLLAQLDAEQRRIGSSPATVGYDRHQGLALDLVTSSKMQNSLDVDREPSAVRERYGMTVFGQATLAARRLIENGVKLATVFWDEYKDANTAWDTHVQQYPRLRNDLCPGFDAAFSALIEDLEARGTLDETLVLVVTEHGRTPKLNNAAGGGREHWSGAYSGLMAGGGVRKGSVLGATDRIAAFPKDSPVSPKDVLATVYHLLGVDPETHLHDREGRPSALVPGGKVLREVLA